MLEALQDRTLIAAARRHLHCIAVTLNMAQNHTGALSNYRREQNLISVVRLPEADYYPFAKEATGRPWNDPFVGHRQNSAQPWQEPTREMLIAPPKTAYVVTDARGKQSVRLGRAMPPAEFFDQPAEKFTANSASKNAKRRNMQIYHELDDNDDEWTENDKSHDADSSSLESSLVIREEGTQFVAAVPNIPPALFNFILGKKGATKRSIESQTSTHLQIPTKEFQPDASKRQILIYADMRQSITKAFRAIQATAVRARKTMSPSHFVSIPITTLSLGNTVERFLAFKQTVLEEFGAQCRMSNSNFVNENKLHITMCMALLLTKEECDVAKSIFERVCRQKMIGYTFQVAIQGLDIMNDDPSACSIVYAKVQSANAMLQELAASFAAAFQRQNFVAGKNDSGAIKLHVTVMRARRNNAVSNESDADDFAADNDDDDDAAAAAVDLNRADELTDVPSAKSSAVERDMLLGSIGVDAITGKAKPSQKTFQPPKNKAKKGRPVMDIRPFLEKYGNYDFGTTMIDAVHLSVRMTTDTATQYYKSIATYELAEAAQAAGDDEVLKGSQNGAAEPWRPAGALTAAAVDDEEGGEEDAEDAQPDAADDRDFVSYDDDGLECG